MKKLSTTMMIALAALVLAGGPTMAFAQDNESMESGINQSTSQVAAQQNKLAKKKAMELRHKNNPTPVPPYDTNQGGSWLQQPYDAAE